MDEQKVREAIELLQREICTLDAQKENDEYCSTVYNETLDLTIGLYETAIEALEKQLPKEAKKIDIIDPVTYQTNGRFYLCKCCEESCSEYMEYCPGCGQKLDWSEEE